VRRMFPGAIRALRDVHSLKEFANTKIAVASSTTEPGYARKCMSFFEITDGVKMADVVSYQQIFNDNKSKHFQKVGLLLCACMYVYEYRFRELCVRACVYARIYLDMRVEKHGFLHVYYVHVHVWVYRFFII
jgi:hypothetical protein